MIEISACSFRYEARYPDLATARGERFVLIEILWSVGRSVKNWAFSGENLLHAS